MHTAQKFRKIHTLTDKVRPVVANWTWRDLAQSIV